MKKFTDASAAIGLLLFATMTFGQVKIGDNPSSLDPASLLELEGSTRSLVLTRISSAEMQAMNPLPGAVVYNTDEACVFYFNGGTWNNLCNATGSGVSFRDNEDGTFTFFDAGGREITLDGSPETVTSLVEAPLGTFTYTNEDQETTTFALGSGTGSATLAANPDGTYTFDNGNGSPVTFNGAEETVTSLVESPTGTFTFTNEDNETTTFSTGTNATLTANPDGTYTFDNGDGSPVTFNGAEETVTTLVEDPAGIFTYTNEDEQTTTFDLSATEVSGAPGSVFFADATGKLNEDNANLFWDTDTNRMGIGTNTALNSTLNVNGTIGLANGTFAEPSYRFLNGSSTGMLLTEEGQLGFTANGTEKMRISDRAVYINGAPNTVFDFPMLIRANGIDLLGFIYEDNSPGWHLNMLLPNASGFKGGLNFVESGVSDKRFFIEKGGRVGINNRAPTATLDVNGNLKVRDLVSNAPQGQLYNVLVDDSGYFHKSTSTTSAKTTKATTVLEGRWSNQNTLISSTDNRIQLPVFEQQSYNDGGNTVFSENINTMVINQTGRYAITANLVIEYSGSMVAPYVKGFISVNGMPFGATAVFPQVTSSAPVVQSNATLHDVLELKAGDILSVEVEKESSVSWANIKMPSQGSNVILVSKVK